MTYLDAILEAHREAAASDDRRTETLASRALVEPPTRGFRLALEHADGLGVIAEIKRRSPSRGDLHVDLVPGELALSYEAGGATCLSVLTDREHFGGSVDDLREARSAVGLPVLRKDFTVSPNDVCDTRLIGADAVLLIVAALDDAELADFHALAATIGLDALVEVHDEAELERALAIGADLIGVNQRDLVTFEVDHDRARRLAQLMPSGVVTVAESGVRDAADAGALLTAGYDAVLVGESLVTATQPGEAVHALRHAGRERPQE